MLCPLKSCKNGCHCLKSYGFLITTLVLMLVIWLCHINQSLFYTINHWHVILPNKVWETINMLSWSKLYILPLLLCALTFVWRREKLTNVIILVVLYYGVFYLLKAAFGEARPYIVLPQDSFFWLNNYEDAVKSAHKSFPSGHTGNAAVFVFACIRLFFNEGKISKILLLAFLFLVAITRICTGWHWPLDVLGSMVVGYILVQICLCNKTNKAM